MKKVVSIIDYITKGDTMNKILQKLNGKTATEILKEYKIPLEAPIDLNLLLKKIGLSAIETDFTEIEKGANYELGSILGASISNEDNVGIFYREKDSYNRKKFTIAHEIGHCCIDAENLEFGHIELRQNSHVLDSKERKANIFAGELLIPEEVLMKYYKKFINPSLIPLSKIFDVSCNVMAARLDYLGLPYFKDIVKEEISDCHILKTL